MFFFRFLCLFCEWGIIRDMSPCFLFINAFTTIPPDWYLLFMFVQRFVSIFFCFVSHADEIYSYVGRQIFASFSFSSPFTLQERTDTASKAMTIKGGNTKGTISTNVTSYNVDYRSWFRHHAYKSATWRYAPWKQYFVVLHSLKPKAVM